MELKTAELYKSFGEKAVLRGVSFSVTGGRALGILGRNGAGKTTTIRIIMQVFSPDSGEVLLDGQPMTPGKVKIGYLPEERGMYPKKSVMQQLLYFGMLAGLKKREAAANANRLLERLEMTEYRDKRLDTLSKGNQQKIQLVATLIADPDIIILDEPFSGLDPVNAMLLKDLVRELIAKGRIVLFSSHQMNYIEEFCDDIAILNGGKIVLSGDIGEIKRSFDRRTILLSGADTKKIDAFLTEQALPFVSAHEITDGKVAVTLRAPQDKEALYKALEPLAGSVDAFVVKEPTLNEIFVHYTEGAI